MAEEPQNRDPWDEEEDKSDDLWMQKLSGAAKTFQLVVFILVILLVVAMIGFVRLYGSA